MREKYDSSRSEIVHAILKTNYNLSLSPEDIEGIVWPASVMKVILARKAQNRLGKGIPFNYMVTEFTPSEDSKDYSLENNKELAALVQFLKENHSKLPVGLRFQLAVLVGGHWTCIDHIITSRGVAAFNLDSVMDSKARRFFHVYLLNLEKEGLLGAGYIYFVNVPSDGPFAKTPKEKVANMIQTDWISCGIYVVDHLSFLSRTNVFHHLKTNLGESKYCTLGRKDIPPALSAIFRLSQSDLLLENLTKKQKEPTITRKGKKLSEVGYGDAKRKGRKLLLEARNFVENCKEEDYEQIFSHNLLDKLSNYVRHYSTPVNDLIEYIYSGLPGCKNLSDEEAVKLMEKLHGIILLSELNDSQKILAITDLTVSALEKSNEESSYRLLAGVLSYAALNIDDNRQLFDFYTKILTSPLGQGLNNTTNSFFKTPTRFTPALLTHLEKAVKIQLLYNAAVDLENGYKDQFNLIYDLPGCSTFINKPRTFNTSETKSGQILNELTRLAGLEEIESTGSIKQQLEERKKEVLSEFNFKIHETASHLPAVRQ
ncbi:hypothetical protein A8135_06265 [Legionella jamestowniensis]|uniref:Dot/Icm T4SS effector n=1 Tax=Legionella jamestowniensis TaxID=455 RepID=A0ABX2XQ68_9GAMM|nr:hypothetical protein [Legionella jamestowniensis]OCH96757.1 hypothetical protein A8135_06265 [Legionella jamestowniensis]